MEMRTGKFRGQREREVLPPNVADAMTEKDPSWDYALMGDGTQTWLVLRCFDEGVESERIAAVVKVTRFSE